MNRLSRLLVAGCVAIGCAVAVWLQSGEAAATMPAPLPQSSSVQVAQLNSAEDTDFGRHFEDLDVEGSILIYDSANDRTYQHNPTRNQTAFLPASTFKILNSLISLENGVIADEIAILTWDGVTRKVPAWNRDLNMREAFKLSAYPFYQVLARRVGHERMQQGVTQAEYGNQTIGDEEDIDTFWLDGKLRTTPAEQIQFLRRFYQNDLPFSERTFSIVKDIMVVEQTPTYTIRAKSGWVGFDQPELSQVGWYVGYLEKGENVYFFATNIDIRNENDPRHRVELTRRCFEDLGLL